MRKYLWTIMVVLSLGIALHAAPVDSSVARQVAENYWKLHAAKHLRAHALYDVSQQFGFSQLYLFASDSGFVMVSASNLVRPVLAFGQGYPFDVANQPVQLRDWVGDYAAVIEQMEHDGVEQSSGVANEWNRLLRGSAKPVKSSVAPLITTAWNQGWPFNMLCPYDNARNTRTVAGCGAIAMAQIMKYWNYPIHGKGSHSYMASPYGVQRARFDTTYYDWASMPDKNFTTEAECNAVATLVYHCGVSVDMIYGISADGGSSSYACEGPQGVPTMLKALPASFDYQPSIVCRHRDSYSDDDWINLLCEELSLQRPILYTGADPTAGHAFVVDGFSEDRLFHINWGWGGAFDGFYAMGAFNPGGGGAGGNSTYTFNLINSAIMGIIPNGVLKCNPDVLSVGSYGGVATAYISSNMINPEPWTISCDADWVSIVPRSGAGYGDTTMVKMVVFANITGESRSANITFSQGAEQVHAVLYQNDCGIITTFPYQESFEDSLTCWYPTGIDGANKNELGIKPGTPDAEAFDGNMVFQFGSSTPTANYDQYLVSPYMILPDEATMQFQYRRNYSYNESFEILTSTTTDDLESFTNLIKSTTVNKAGWRKQTVKLPKDTRYVAFHYTSKNQRTLSIDDIQITVPEQPTPPAPQAIASVDNDDATLSLQGRQLTISDCQGSEVSIIDMLGRSIYSNRAMGGEVSVTLPARGIYLVRIGSAPAQKITVIH